MFMQEQCTCINIISLYNLSVSNMKCESAPKINPDGEMVISSVYASYMRHLLGGDYSDCIKIVKELVASQVDFRDIYTKLFQRSLYEVGELWEKNEIPVAHEHMVTALTELLLTVLHPHIFRGQRCGKKALVACAAEGTHRIGAKMVTDIFELHGWDAVFVPTPVSIEGILLLLDKHCPDMLGLSLTHNFHLPFIVTY